MIDDVADIAAFYSTEPNEEHHRLERHQLEYDLILRYLGRYLPANGSILEVGAATGTYTVALAKRGYSVTAVDLSLALIDKCRESVGRVQLSRRVTFAVADARNLNALALKKFDAVLLMGPLYHLVVEADRRLAIKQAYDRLQTGGVIVSSFISRFGSILRQRPLQPRRWSWPVR